MVVVEKLPYANTSEVTKGVEEALDELRPGLAGPEDGRVDLPARELRRHVRRQPQPHPSLVGAVLLLLVLAAPVLQLAARRSPRWSRSCCRSSSPRSCSTASDQTFNAVVLAGLVMALGAVVHDAVVSVDAHGTAG